MHRTPFTVLELDEVLYKLKPGKNRGVNGLPAELYRRLPLNLKRHLAARLSDIAIMKTGREVGSSTRDWGCPAGGTYQGAFAHPPTALLPVPPQSGSPTWGKGAVAASSTLQRVLPREVTHVRPKSHIPLLRADDTWGRVPSHILINLRILGPRGPEPGQRPCPAGTPTWVGFQYV